MQPGGKYRQPLAEQRLLNCERVHGKLLHIHLLTVFGAH
jgi:hypothetical protein